MKKGNRLCCFLLLFVLTAFLAAGCEKKQEEEKGYMVYYVNATGTRLMESSYNPSAQTFDEMMAEMMGQLASAPTGYLSAIPRDVAFTGYERGIDALRVDFSDGYYDLDNTQEVLLRAAVVKTLCQIPGVTKVMLTVGGEQVHDREGDPVPAMDADTFIDTKEGGINSYQYATLDLYFASAQGDRIDHEARSLHYSSNMVLERVVVEQLLKGPQKQGMKPVAVSSTRIQNIYTQNGICTINFDEKFNETPSESPVDAEAAIYAIVNSICQTCDSITGVKFEINGEKDVTFRGEVDLDQIFMMNENIIETEEMQTDISGKETEAAEQTETEPEDSETAQADESDEQQTEEVITGKTVVGVEPSLNGE